MVGPKVNTYPETVKRIAELNCELGNHSTNYRKLTKLDAAGIQKRNTDNNRCHSKSDRRKETYCYASAFWSGKRNGKTDSRTSDYYVVGGHVGSEDEKYTGNY